MSGHISLTSKVAAATLFIINLLAMVLCLILFGLSLWMISAPASMSRAIQNYGTPAIKSLLTPATLSLQLGVGSAVLTGFFIFITFMGLYGAVSRSTFVLFMYSTLVLLLLLLECALLFYFSSSLVEKGLQEQDGQWTHALRLAFQCCEHNITIPQVTKIPWSCCGTAGFPDNCTNNIIFSEPCQRVIPSWLDRYLIPIYASLAILHVVLATCAVVRRSRS